jgi:outer membrane lipoprotein
MKHPKFIVMLLMGILAAGFFGCATSPISKEVRAEVQENLTFPMVLKNPAAYKGSVVLWGGSIIETVKVPEGTEIFVLQTPLDYMEMPESSSFSEGRFIAKSTDFLDPEIYKNGKKITLAGEISGEETHPLGKSSYTYPVIGIKELHLWRQNQRYVYPYPYYGYYDWYYGPYGPGWGWRWGWAPGWYYYRYDRDGAHFRDRDEYREKDHDKDKDHDQENMK